MKREKKETKPKDIGTTTWENRRLVNAKLDIDTFSRFNIFCKQNNLNKSEAIKQLLSTHHLITTIKK